MNSQGKRKLAALFEDEADAEGYDVTLDEDVEEQIESPSKRARLLPSKENNQPTLNSPLLPSADMAVLFSQGTCNSCSNESVINDQNKSNALCTADITDELECVICSDTFLKPYTLQCSHTFCKKCITTWMKVRKSCPSCRKLLTRQPVYNMPLDKIIQVVLKKMKPEEQQDMDRRRSDLEKEESDALERFISTIKSAKERGVVFLNISNPWNDNERLLFKTGVERYEGMARRLYCELTNFSLDFIKNALPEQLEIGCRNLGFLIPKIVGSTTSTDYNLIRMILRDFLCN